MKPVSASLPPSSEQNTGSPSSRGKQCQTCRPSRPTRLAIAQLPTTARFNPCIAGSGTSDACDLLQPVTYFLRATSKTLEHVDGKAAHCIGRLETVVIRQIVADENRNT